MRVTRRGFLKNATIAGAVAGFPTIIPASVLGKDGKLPPSERVGVGLIACGSRARFAYTYNRNPKSQVVAVCDPVLDRRKKFSSNLGNCQHYGDFRELLARKDVDAVHIATSDHWHVPIALLAAKAGKDIYGEKPLGLSINHDKAARAIVDKYKRVFQYGAQQRSMTHVRLGIQLVLNGHIGDVREIYVWAPHGEAGGSPTPVLPVPDGFDYNMWLGPAPNAPYCHDRVPLDKFGTLRNGIFHIYDYAIGFIGGWGAHPMDMMQWWADNAGRQTIPVHYEATGVLPTEGLFNTVTNWDMHATYADGLKLHFMDNQTVRKVKHPGITGSEGTLFIGTKGWVTVRRGGWNVSSEEIRRRAKTPGEKLLKVSRNQIHNFIDCVIGRETPVDDLHSAVRSDIICHLTDIAIREGKPITWDNDKEMILDNPSAARRMSRDLRAPWTLDA